RARHDVRQRDAGHADLRHARRQFALLRGGCGDRHDRLRRNRRAGQVPAARRGDRMSAEAELPLIVAAAVALLVVLGALLAFLGSYGLLRLGSFYERVHPPTMGATLGTALVLAASAILFSTLES